MNYLFLTLFFFQCAAAGLEFEWTETLCGVQYQATGLDTAVDVSTGRTVAVKFVKTTEKIHENELLLQVLKMKLFSGDENFVQLICHHQDNPVSILVMEHCNQGNLWTHAPLTPPQLVTFWNQLSQALKTMKQKQIVHRDLKLQNIFMHDGQMKIGGFELTEYLGSTRYVVHPAGTIPYLAPEVIVNLPHDYQVDLWASGVLLYQLLVGQHPYIPPFQQNYDVTMLMSYMFAFGRNPNRLASIQLQPFVPVVDALLRLEASERRIETLSPPISTFCGADFQIKKQLGQGAFGQVYQAENVATKHLVAIKFVTTSNKHQRKLFNREVKAMKQFVGDDRFVQLYCSVKQDDVSVIVMEYCNQGDLSSAAGTLEPQEVRTLWSQLSGGIESMRAKRIVHRDLKPENIFVHDGLAKIGDFGLAKRLKEGEMAWSRSGTALYMAPEVLLDQPYDFQVDLWSTGVVLYVALHGINPFTRQGNPPSVQELLDSMDAFLADNHRYDPLLQDIFDGLLQRDPKDRRIHRI